MWELWQRQPGFRPTVALASASGTPYRLTWRPDLDLPNKYVFLEPHSPLPERYVYGSFQGRRVLVVDDEVTTGRTAANLAGVLTAAGADVVGIACLVEDTAGGGRTFLTERGMPLCALTAL